MTLNTHIIRYRYRVYEKFRDGQITQAEVHFGFGKKGKFYVQMSLDQLQNFKVKIRKK